MTVETLVAALWLAQAAQQPSLEEPPGAAEAPSLEHSSAPARGFQCALAIQRSAPRGDIHGGARQEDLIASAYELQAQAALRIARRWSMGAYATIGRGGPEEDIDHTCRFAGAACVARTARAGLLAGLDVGSVGPANTWVALGVGAQRHSAEAAARVLTSGSPDAAVLVVRSTRVWLGPEARISAGADYRAARWLGVGLFGALSVGWYRDVSQYDEVAARRSPLRSDFWGTWLTFGVRGVLFP